MSGMNEETYQLTVLSRLRATTSRRKTAKGRRRTIERTTSQIVHEVSRAFRAITGHGVTLRWSR
jgi:hypothetical protein